MPEVQVPEVKVPEATSKTNAVFFYANLNPNLLYSIMAATVEGRIQWPRKDERNRQRMLILGFHFCVVLWGAAAYLRNG